MKIDNVDPSMIAVDAMNERQQPEVGEEFVENVRAVGIKQPPMVRKLNGGMEASMGAEYSVVLGGRRVDAATQAGLESIPVIVVDWDDAEALESSITENIDTFRKDVSKKDRAKAVERLKDLNGWDNSEVAEHLGVSANTIRKWREPVHSDYKGTSLHADEPDDPEMQHVNPKANKSDEGQEIKEPTYSQMETARRRTGGAKESEQAVKAMQSAGVRETKDVSEVDERVKNRYGDKASASQIEDVALEVAAEKQGGDTGPSHYIDFTATGTFADAIEAAAEDRSATNREIVRTATRQWLESEDYL